MFHDESWKTIYFGVKRSKVKVKRREKKTSLCRCSNGTKYCHLLLRKLCWVFPAAVPHRTSHASDTGFSLRQLPAADAAADRRFSVRGVFRSQPAATTLL